MDSIQSSETHFGLHLCVFELFLSFFLSLFVCLVFHLLLFLLIITTLSVGSCLNSFRYLTTPITWIASVQATTLTCLRSLIKSARSHIVRLFKVGYFVQPLLRLLYWPIFPTDNQIITISRKQSYKAQKYKHSWKKGGVSSVELSNRMRRLQRLSRFYLG